MYVKKRPLSQRAERHLKKLNLGRFFAEFDATWSGEEARHFRDLLTDLCDTLDRIGAKRLDELCEELDSELRNKIPGGHVAMSTQLHLYKNRSYLQIMLPNISLLDQAYKYKMRCRWEQRGCHAMYHLVKDLIFKNDHIVPYLVQTGRIKSVG